MIKKISRKFTEAYLFVGFLGFLLVTIIGSNMIETILEKDISSDLYQSAYRIAENEDIRHNITAASLDNIKEKPVSYTHLPGPREASAGLQVSHYCVFY